MQHMILIGINMQVGKTMLIFRPALKNECQSEENYSWSVKPAITSNGEHRLEHYAFVWIFIVPAHWNNSACLNMSLHSGHITLNLSQPIFALTPYCVPSREAVNTSFIVFGLILSCSNTRSTTLETNMHYTKCCICLVYLKSNHCSFQFWPKKRVKCIWK